jgi:nitroimidazol reductase NimA-like FMN-containing flavoprotein (pyridoxamine 5'-phosphate oxidase superfamily)
MRRKDKEIQSRGEIDAVIRGCQVCHLGLALENEPYVVPVSFGYDGSSLFFHTAASGRKIGFIEANNRVCFQFERDVKLQTDPEIACKWSFAFESVIGYGTVSELTEPAEKARGINQIMLQYSGREWEVNASVLAKTRVWQVRIESLTGKRGEEKAS